MLQRSNVSVLQFHCVDICLLGEKSTLVDCMLIAYISLVAVDHPIPINLINFLQLAQLPKLLLVFCWFYISFKLNFSQHLKEKSDSHLIEKINSDDRRTKQCYPYIFATVLNLSSVCYPQAVDYLLTWYKFLFAHIAKLLLIAPFKLPLFELALRSWPAFFQRLDRWPIWRFFCML